jgi:phage terminase Nu1 subunit (DNA packaging protein)
MSKPTNEQIAAALGVQPRQISQLAKRGMPVSKVSAALEWFTRNGFGVVVKKGYN